MTPAALTSFCARATLETLRRNPVTAPYETTFFNVAKRNGLSHARAWLLGCILLDDHVDPDPQVHLPLQQDAQPVALNRDAPGSPRARLQQHIENAALQCKTPPQLL